MIELTLTIAIVSFTLGYHYPKQKDPVKEGIKTVIRNQN